MLVVAEVRHVFFERESNLAALSITQSDDMPFNLVDGVVFGVEASVPSAIWRPYAGCTFASTSTSESRSTT